MKNLSPHWRSLVQNLFLYLVLLAGLMLAFPFIKNGFFLALIWVFALGGIITLGFQAAGLTVGAEREGVHAEAKLQSYLEQTNAYKKQIERVLKSAAKKSVRPDRLRSQVDAWTRSIEDLIERIGRLRANPLIQQDLQRVPRAIAELEAKLGAETDEVIREQLARTLENRQKQADSLQALQNSIRRAEIQIESTVSMLGTIYSQLLTSQSTSDVADYSRLSDEVDEEVSRLQDHLEALREVKLSDG